MDVIKYENEIGVLRENYRKKLEIIYKSLTQENDGDKNSELFEFHNAGVDFFNKFERSLDEYSLPNIPLTQDVINRKAEDALNMVVTIVNHWLAIEKFCDKFKFPLITPSETSYASIQRVIKRLLPNSIEKSRQQFIKANLPTYGFDSTKTHSGWSEKDKFNIQLKVGIVILIITGIMIFQFPTLSGLQYIFLRALLSLGISMVGISTISGALQMNWTYTQSLKVTASGWLGVFLMLYYINPPSPPHSIK